MRVWVFVVLLILVGFIGSLFGYALGYQHLLPRLTFVSITSPTPVPSRVAGVAATPEASISSALSSSPTPIPTVAPTTVVNTFMKEFTQIKTTNTNDQHAQNAVNQLTTDAKKIVSQEANGSLSSGLAKFAGVQSVPDGGYTIGKPTTADNTIVIATTWSYLSGPLTKVFYLIQEGGQWKIDTIRDK